MYKKRKYSETARNINAVKLTTKRTEQKQQIFFALFCLSIFAIVQTLNFIY